MSTIAEKREEMAECLDEADPRTDWEVEFVDAMTEKMANPLWVPTEDQLAKAKELAQR